MEKKEYMAFLAKKISDVKVAEINGDSTLEELGLDSIEFVELIVEIESEYGFEFDEEELNLEKYYCINDLIATIIRHIEHCA